MGIRVTTESHHVTLLRTVTSARGRPPPGPVRMRARPDGARGLPARLTHSQRLLDRSGGKQKPSHPASITEAKKPERSRKESRKIGRWREEDGGKMKRMAGRGRLWGREEEQIDRKKHGQK